MTASPTPHLLGAGRHLAEAMPSLAESAFEIHLTTRQIAALALRMKTGEAVDADRAAKAIDRRMVYAIGNLHIYRKTP